MFAIQGHVDRPRPTETCRGHRIPIEGWVYLDGGRHDDLRAVRVTGPDGSCVGRTHFFYHRPEVMTHLGLPVPVAVAFSLHAALAEWALPEGGECELHLALEVRGEPAPIPWQTLRCRLRADDLWGRQHFHVLRPSVEDLLHRDDVYSSGPSSRVVNAEIFALLLRYLPAGGRLLDIGCGTGPFGPPLRENGVDGVGVEVKDEGWRPGCRTCRSRLASRCPSLTELSTAPCASRCLNTSRTPTRFWRKSAASCRDGWCFPCRTSSWCHY